MVLPGGGPANQLDVFTERNHQITTSDLSVPTTLDFPTGFTVNVRAGGVYVAKKTRFFLGLTWEGFDSTITDPQLASLTSQARASLAAFVRVIERYL